MSTAVVSPNASASPPVKAGDPKPSFTARPAGRTPRGRATAPIPVDRR